MVSQHFINCETQNLRRTLARSEIHIQTGESVARKLQSTFSPFSSSTALWSYPNHPYGATAEMRCEIFNPVYSRSPLATNLSRLFSPSLVFLSQQIRCQALNIRYSTLLNTRHRPLVALILWDIRERNNLSFMIPSSSPVNSINLPRDSCISLAKVYGKVHFPLKLLISLAKSN